MLRVEVVKRETGLEGVNSTQRLGVKDAGYCLEIGRHRKVCGQTVGNIDYLAAGCVLRGDVVEPSGVKGNIELAPIEFLGDVTAAEIQSIDAECAKVFQGIHNRNDVPESVTRNKSREQLRII